MTNSKISALTSATTPLAGTETLPIVQSNTTKQVSVANLTDGRAVSVASLTASGVVSSQGLQAAITPSLSFGASKWMTQYEGSNTSRTYVCGDSAGSYGVWQVYIATSTGAPIETIKFDGSANVTITTGNVVQGTAGKGINFTANTPAAGKTSQLLNWYEEGTWTPGVSFGGGTTGITYSTQAGTYTRIGNRVLFQGRIVLTNKGSSTGSAVVTGLPFSTNATATAYGAFSVQMNNVLSTTTTPIGQIVPGVTTLTLAQLTAGINTLLTSTDFANNTVVNVTGLSRN